MGNLYIVATPIGNLEDMTYRAVKILRSVDVILCEDTRHTGLLLQKYDIQTSLMPYYDEIEDKRIPEIIALLLEGKSAALVSDAGTPLISDPGYRLVRACKNKQIPVVSIPGPSAAIAALTGSGLPTDKFLFLGYPPEKHAARQKLLSGIPHYITVIMYCAPHKFIQTLEDMKSILGDIDITVARELTKVHEETWSGTIAGAMQHFTKPQGEIVLLFHLL